LSIKKPQQFNELQGQAPVYENIINLNRNAKYFIFILTDIKMYGTFSEEDYADQSNLC
jgi:hypothetical protein